MKSEKEAFINAMNLAGETGIKIKTIRLDKYYSNQSTARFFGKQTKLYIIPKKNSTIHGSPEWKQTLKHFVNETISYLHEYFKRNLSESAFSADKRLTNWKIWQKRDDRIRTALMCSSR